MWALCLGLCRGSQFADERALTTYTGPQRWGTGTYEDITVRCVRCLGVSDFEIRCSSR